MSSADKLVDRTNLAFLLYDWLGIERLTEREVFADHSRESFDQTLELAHDIATQYFAPHNHKADENEPVFENGHVKLIPEVKVALDAYVESGLLSAPHAYDLGGIQLPYVLTMAANGFFSAANVGSQSYFFLTAANANVIAHFGTEDQKQRFLRPLLDGRFFGTMCLSEPQAGSSLGDLTTRAEPVGDGTYRIIGNKMWISAADHDLSENIVHLVLAKIPGGPPGVKGISLFIVPKLLVNDDGSIGAPNDVAVAGVNHKFGYRGTVNCALNFGENGGAIGYLVGEEHKGLAYMFHMMNEARVGVGFGAVMLASTGYLHALQYARDRKQGRLPASRDPLSEPVSIVEHADVRRMLLEQKGIVEGALALCLYAALLVDEKDTHPGDEERRRAALLLDFLTPIVKGWCSQSCVRASDLAIQVYGGYGYSREYPVEQFYRDNRLNPIHEGTDGIQSLDLLARKATMLQGAALKLWQRAIENALAAARAAGSGDLGGLAAGVEAALRECLETTAVLGAAAAAGNAAVAQSNSMAYLEMMGRTTIGWMWLEQAVALAKTGRDDDFARGKRHTARYYVRYELAPVARLGATLRALDDTLVEMQEAWF